MPSDARYTSLTVTVEARNQLRELKTLFFRHGVPEGIPAPTRALAVSNVIEIAAAIVKRELEKTKRKK